MLNMNEAAKPGGADAEAMHRWSRRPLADFECRHGRLEHDPTPDCGCWTVAAPAEPYPVTLDDLAPELAAAAGRAAREFGSTPLGQLAEIRRAAIAAGRLQEEDNAA